MDIDEPDDYGTQITETSKDDWDESLQEFRDPDREKLTQEPEQPPDVLGEGYIEEEPLEREP